MNIVNPLDRFRTMWTPLIDSRRSSQGVRVECFIRPPFGILPHWKLATSRHLFHPDTTLRGIAIGSRVCTLYYFLLIAGASEQTKCSHRRWAETHSFKFGGPWNQLKRMIFVGCREPCPGMSSSWFVDGSLAHSSKVLHQPGVMQRFTTLRLQCICICICIIMYNEYEYQGGGGSFRIGNL